MFCQKCGKELPDNAKFCYYCGWQNYGTPIKKREQKSQFIAIVLCLLLGLIGIHDFYLGRNGQGVLKLLITVLLGWCYIGLIINGIWCIIDFISILGKFFDCLLTDEELQEKEQRELEYQKKLRGNRENEIPTAQLLMGGAKENEKVNN